MSTCVHVAGMGSREDESCSCVCRAQTTVCLLTLTERDTTRKSLASERMHHLLWRTRDGDFIAACRRRCRCSAHRRSITAAATTLARVPALRMLRACCNISPTRPPLRVAASVRVLTDAQRLHQRMSAGRRRTILGSYPGGGAVVSHQCVGSSCPSARGRAGARDVDRAAGCARQSPPPRVRDHWWRGADGLMARPA